MSTEISRKLVKASTLTTTAGVPPLENGDHLTRREFERRYTAQPHLKRAELIEGRVYMPSPVHLKSHAQPHAQIMLWLGTYCVATPGVEFADNATLRLDPDNEPQPDAMLWITEAAGGRARISEDDYLEGAPELIVEIAATSASYDLHDKRHAYRRNAVQEYVVWRVYDREIDWFVLQEERYERLLPDAKGVTRSRVLPGLCLDIAAMLDGNLPRVLSAASACLRAKAHTTFVKRLAKALRK